MGKAIEDGFLSPNVFKLCFLFVFCFYQRILPSECTSVGKAGKSGAALI